jgi:hypothetical protein
MTRRKVEKQQTDMNAILKILDGAMDYEVELKTKFSQNDDLDLVKDDDRTYYLIVAGNVRFIFNESGKFITCDTEKEIQYNGDVDL